MFDIGWSEMLVVGAVALVVIGPKDLPAALRQAGRWMGAARRAASDFQGHVNRAMREAELDELSREVTNLKSNLSGAEMRSLIEKPQPKPALKPQPAEPVVTATVKPRRPRKKAAPKR